MRFMLPACLLLALSTVAAADTLKLTAPQEGKALGNLERRKSNTAPATIEELFTPKHAPKTPLAAKPDATVILRDIDAKLDALQQQIDKLNGLDGVPDEKLLAAIDRMNTLSSALAAMQKKSAVTGDGDSADTKE
jgi:hypothetical protein